MRHNGLETQQIDKYFSISITHETDISLDQGYTFEEVTLGVTLNKEQAWELLTELVAFINES